MNANQMTVKTMTRCNSANTAGENARGDKILFQLRQVPYNGKTYTERKTRSSQ